MIALMVRASWPLLECPNPNSGPEHQFEFYGLGGAFVCDGCGAMLSAEDAPAWWKWGSYVLLSTGNLN